MQRHNTRPRHIFDCFVGDLRELVFQRFPCGQQAEKGWSFSGPGLYWKDKGDLDA
jgi:hypothetical protein